MQVDKDKGTRLRRRLGFSSSLFLMILFFMLQSKPAEASASITVKEINYDNSTITLQLGTEDTRVYLSDSSKKKWDEIPGTITADRTITTDISWISATRNYVMNFKSNSSANIVSVTLPKQTTNFKVNFNKVKGTIAFGNVGNRTIQWRKKGSTTWNTVDTATIASELNYLSTNGAIVYFRLASVNGSASGIGFRPSKEVAITIPKKASAPSVTIDGSAFSIAVKKGMAYRTVNKDGTTSDWVAISANSSLLLKNIAANALYTDTASSQSEVELQFRTNATNAGQVSKISTVTVPVQEGPPNTETYGISLSYTSSTTLSLQVKAANATVPFEYIVIDADKELNYQTAKWSAITSSTAVTMDKTTAKTGAHIYVRKKSIVATDDVKFKLASVDINITGSTGVTYPEAPIPSTLTTLITTAGVCKATKTTSYLTFYLYSASSTTVSSLSFVDAYGVNKGTVTCKSTVAKNPDSIQASDKYIITTKITSTESVDSATEQMLYGKITLANTDVLTSTATTGVQLYLYPGTKVHNPELDDKKEYTNNFKRVYLSNDTEDKKSFKFCLDLGTQYVIDPTAVNKYSSTATGIKSIIYDGYTLVDGTDYTVEYGSYVNADDKRIATATVTVNVARFENSTLIDTTDIAVPLEIYLNNNELLDEDVFITLVNTATLKDIPIAWSITEKSLKETKTSTTTNSDGTKTEVTEEVITYTLELSLFNSSYGVSVADVTWGGISIFGSAKISNGKATINLSNKKINQLTTESTTTNNIVITLSNGFSIKSGCKLTILNAY